MSDAHNTPPERVAQLHAIRDHHKGDATSTQRGRLLAALQELRSVTTFEAMRHLDIYDPRPRKMELVAEGHEVLTTWRTAVTESGDKHRIGVYTLMRGAAAAGRT